MDAVTKTEGHVVPWNKGKLLGQKPPLKLKERSGLSEFGSSWTIERASSHCSTRHRQQRARVRSGRAPRS